MPIRHILPGDTALIVGPSGAGKSSIVHNIARSVNTGRPFMGLPTVKRPVIADIEDVESRNAAHEALTGGEKVELKWAGLAVACNGVEAIVSKTDNVSAIAEQIEGYPAGTLLIVDNLDLLLPPAVSFSPERLATLAAAIRNALPEQGAFVGTLRATPDELATRYRALAATFDSILTVERLLDVIRLRVIASKYGSEGFYLDTRLWLPEIGRTATGEVTRAPALEAFPLQPWADSW